MAKRSFLSLVFAIFFANTKLSAAAEIPALCSTPSFSVFTTPKVIQIFQPEGFETFSGKYNNSNSLCVFIVFDDALPANFTLLGTSDFDEPIVLLEVEVTRQRPFLNDAFSNFSVTEDSFISTDENGNIADWLIQTTFRDISLLTQGNSSATVFGEVHLR